MRIASLVAVFRRWSFVREVGGQNRGAWVQFFQRRFGGKPGDSWCCFLTSLVIDVAYDGRAPIKLTGNCAEMLADARRRGYEVFDPQPEDLYFYLDATGHAHHVGVVTVKVPALEGIAGNTSPDGKSSNGDGVYEHGIAGRMAFVRLPA